jgi:hypothetical protein
MANTTILLVVVAVVGLVCVVSSVTAFIFRDTLAGLFNTGKALSDAQKDYGSNAVDPAANGLCPNSESGGSPSCADGFVLSTSKKKCCPYDADNSAVCSTNATKATLPTFFWGTNFKPHSNIPLALGVGEYPEAKRDWFKSRSNKPGGLRVPKGFVAQLHSRKNYGGDCFQYGAGEHYLGRGKNFERHGVDSLKIFCGDPKSGGACV